MEEGFVVLIAVATAIIGMVVGMLMGKTKAERRYLQDTRFTHGTLNIDCSDPEFDPGLFLCLAVPVKDVISRKYITLDISVLLQDSQK